MGEPTKYILIEDEFNDEEKMIMWMIREFRRRFIRIFPEFRSKFIILIWFLYKDHDPRNETGWKNISTAYKKLKEHKIDIIKYFDYVFGSERQPTYYYLGSRTYLNAYLHYREYEYQDEISEYEREKEMVIAIIKERNLKNEEDLFRKVPSMMTILSKEYLESSDAYKKLKESGYLGKIDE